MTCRTRRDPGAGHDVARPCDGALTGAAWASRSSPYSDSMARAAPRTSNNARSVADDASARRARRAGSRTRRSTASASSSARPGGTSSPSTPSVITSGTPPTVVATTGNPALIASMSATGRPFLVRGQHEEVGPGHQAWGVGAGAEETEVPGETAHVGRPLQLGLEGTAPDGEEPDRAARRHGQAGRLEEDVVALLAAQVGDGQREHLVVADPQLAPHGASERRALLEEGGEAGAVHSVHHDARPRAARPRARRRAPPPTPRRAPGRPRRWRG